MTIHDALRLRPVERAMELGWKSRDKNLHARKHFCFYLEGAVKVEAHFFQGNPLYTVGDTTTTNVWKAIELVEDASRCRRSPVTSHESPVTEGAQ
jgi:hypothetical protein